MTIVIDDAGYGDLLFGAVIGAYRPETDHFIYDVIDVKHFQKPRFRQKTWLREARRIALRLVKRLGLEEGEKIRICRGTILDEASAALAEQFGEERMERCKVEGRAQELVELAFINEIRNLGYEPREDRTERWGRNFWDMFRWIRDNPEMLKYTKSGWPRLKRYKIFRDP